MVISSKTKEHHFSSKIPMYENQKKNFLTSDKNSMFTGQPKAEKAKFDENFCFSCIKYSVFIQITKVLYQIIRKSISYMVIYLFLK